MIHRVPHQTISLLLVGLLALVSTNPVHAQKGKKPPQDDPGPTLPSLQYSISLVPKDIRPMHANHSGMIVGTTNSGSGAGLYDPVSSELYDFNAETHLMDQIQASAPGMSFGTARAINESGAIVGALSNDDGEYARRGFVIDTGQSLEVTDWVVKLLPNFGSSDSNALAINDVGDVLVNYYVVDENGLSQGIHYYVVNPWLDPYYENVRELPIGYNTPTSPGRAITRLNNQGIVAVAKPDRILLFDANVNPPQILREISIVDCRHLWLNDAGVIGGVTYSERVGGKKAYDVVFQEDGIRENIYLNSPFSMASLPNYREFMNSRRDMAFHAEVAVNGTIRDAPYLFHRGFTSNDHATRTWRIDDLIADDDPNRSLWYQYDPTVSFVSDRSDTDDATGYPVIVANLRGAVILVPQIVP